MCFASSSLPVLRFFLSSGHLERRTRGEPPGRLPMRPVGSAQPSRAMGRRTLLAAGLPSRVSRL